MKKIDWTIKQNTDFQYVLKSFSRYLERRGLRPSTIEEYVGHTKRYLTYAKTDRPSPHQWDAFQGYLHDKKLARNTLNQYAYAVKAYHKMHNEDIAIRRLEPNNTIPHYFDEDDVIEIFSVCKNIKHLAMLSLMFHACLRASELCDIDDNDLDLKRLTIRIRNGKGGKEAIVFITGECAQTLRNYPQVRPVLEIDGKRPLFYSNGGKRFERTLVHHTFTLYKKKAGIKKTDGVHVFARHSPATLLIRRGCDIRLVKEIMRHNDIATTMRYAHVADETKRAAYDKANPHA